MKVNSVNLLTKFSEFTEKGVFFVLDNVCL